MHLVIIFILLFGCYSTLPHNRPSHLQEENNSEIEGGEYESEESVDDEYISEEAEPAVDEVPDIQNSEDQELIQDTRLTSNKHFDNNREDSEKFTEAETKKEVVKNNPNDASYHSERFSFVKEHPNYIFGTNKAAETEESQPSRTDYQKNRIECRNVDQNSKQLVSDNYGDFLFKNFHDHMKKDNSDYIEDRNQQSYIKKPYNNHKPLENKAAKNYDYFSDRNRRQVQNYEEKPVTSINNNKNENLDAVNENTILKNIKKLSEQDLEDLMNSLPEDKKALLKKIMDKREITKKAGAIEENNSLDQSDTSKIEESYSENGNSVSSLSSYSDTTETNKNIENSGGLNTKVSDTENDSGKVGSKSAEISDTSTTEEISEITDGPSKDEANINNNNKENIKSDNKREVNGNFFTNENIPIENSIVLDNKNLNEFPIHEESSENEVWLEPKNEELISEPRDASQGDPSDLSASIEKLEDSFPNVNAYENADSELEPLIRIKRKGLQHIVKKRDLPFSTKDNKVFFISDFESEGSENEEKNALKESLYSQSDCLKKDLEGSHSKVINL